MRDQPSSSICFASLILVARKVEPLLSGWLFIIMTLCLALMPARSVLSMMPMMSWAYLRVMVE